MPSSPARPGHASPARWLALLRGVGFGCTIGPVLGGVMGTLSWPGAGTLYGAVAGAAAGAAMGLADGLVLMALAGLTRSPWLTRCASAAVAAACAATASAFGGFGSTLSSGGQVALTAVCLLLAGWLGPFIAYGAEPIALGRRAAPRPLSRIAAVFLLRGAAVGAAPGGIIGLVIGIRVYLPTAPAAAVDAALLGAVSGIVLGLLLCAAVVGPKLRVAQ